MNGMKERKQLDMELMRILAAFFVIFNHTRGNGFQLFAQYDPNSPQFWVYLFPTVFCKFSVPLFFMISGALLLGREQISYRNLWTRRIPRMACILLFWSGVYYLVDVLRGWEEPSIVTFLTVLYEDAWTVPFWYLYAYLAFLISLPLLQRFARGLQNRDFGYLIVVFLAFSCLLPTAQFFLWRNGHSLNGSLRVSWACSSILFYPCLGYFLRHRVRDFWNGKRLAVLWLCNLAAIALSGYITYLCAVESGDPFSKPGHELYAAVNATAIFASCQYLMEHAHVPLWIQKGIRWLGECTFGVYLLHVLFVTSIPLFAEHMDVLYQKFHVNHMVSTFTYCGFVFLLCSLITQILKRIPILKKLVS